MNDKDKSKEEREYKVAVRFKEHHAAGKDEGRGANHSTRNILSQSIGGGKSTTIGEGRASLTRSYNDKTISKFNHFMTSDWQNQIEKLQDNLKLVKSKEKRVKLYST